MRQKERRSPEQISDLDQSGSDWSTPGISSCPNFSPRPVTKLWPAFTVTCHFQGPYIGKREGKHLPRLDDLYRMHRTQSGEETLNLEDTNVVGNFGKGLDLSGINHKLNATPSRMQLESGWGEHNASRVFLRQMLRLLREEKGWEVLPKSPAVALFRSRENVTKIHGKE